MTMPRSVMEELTSLMLAVPGITSPPGTVASWYERKADLLERIAGDGGNDARFAADLAVTARRHADLLHRHAA